MSRKRDSSEEKHQRTRGIGRKAAESMIAASGALLASPRSALGLLERAEITGCQVVPTGTNYTFFAFMSAPDSEPFLAIYKPRRGENPLWDYPDGTLYKREHAAYVTSVHLGWPNIPPTVIRDGPLGIGMVQLFVPSGEGWEFRAIRVSRSAELMEIALFDLIVNNGDRKAGHCIPGVDGRLWAIDHGLTFNPATRLRTVLWDYCGEPIPERLLSQLRTLVQEAPLREELAAKLRADLDPEDVEAFFRRTERFVRDGRYPQLDPNRNLPWPMI